MTFNWQGRLYDTATMAVIQTQNPAMPAIYVDSTGGVFVCHIERVEGIEVRQAGRQEAIGLAERYGFLDLLPSVDAQLETASANAVKPHALIVEDDGLSRHSLVRLLNRSGYEVICAATIAEASAKLNANPTWLILDLQLPDGWGTTLLERVRAESLPIKVAITTGETDKKLLSQIQGLQPDAIFHKPLNIQEVVHWLDAA